jgi:uncharacterized membrane protein
MTANKAIRLANFTFAPRTDLRHFPKNQMSLSNARALNFFYWTGNVALAVAFVFEIFTPFPAPDLDATLIALAAIASVGALARQLPLQNVLLAAALTAIIGTVAHGISLRLGIPFGPIIFNRGAGPELFNLIPWTIPFLWIAAIFISRGVARMILRPWRKLRNYGFWLIGVTAALAVAFDFALEPFAKSKHWWRWMPTKFSATWFGAPLINFLSWAFVTLLILAFATPALIKKQPGNTRALDWQPLFLWLGAFLLFAIDCAQAGLWPAVFADAGILIITTASAIRGARW